MSYIGDGFTCPAGWTSTPDRRLCIGPMKEPNNMLHAIYDCKQDDARVCSHTDMQQACGIDGFNPFGDKVQGWYSDHGTAPGGNWVRNLLLHYLESSYDYFVGRRIWHMEHQGLR